MVTTYKLCPNEMDDTTGLTKKIKVMYGDYEIPGIYSIEITDTTLRILLDKALRLNGNK